MIVAVNVLSLTKLLRQTTCITVASGALLSRARLLVLNPVS